MKLLNKFAVCIYGQNEKFNLDFLKLLSNFFDGRAYLNILQHCNHDECDSEFDYFCNLKNINLFKAYSKNFDISDDLKLMYILGNRVINYETNSGVRFSHKLFINLRGINDFKFLENLIFTNYDSFQNISANDRNIYFTTSDFFQEGLGFEKTLESINYNFLFGESYVMDVALKAHKYYQHYTFGNSISSKFLGLQLSPVQKFEQYCSCKFIKIVRYNPI